MHGRKIVQHLLENHQNMNELELEIFENNYDKNIFQGTNQDFGIIR